MDLTKEEYERLIELQAVALGCAERSLATLREEHERLKKDLEHALKERDELRALYRASLESCSTCDCYKEAPHKELKKALKEERKLTRDLREEHERLKKDLEEERKLTRDLRRQIVASAQTKAQEVLS